MDSKGNPKLILYKRRWLMLGYFTFVTIAIGMLTGTCVTIAPIIKEIYGISSLETNFASLLYGIIYVPMNFVSIAVLNR